MKNNLGWYKILTTSAKKVGGPLPLVGCILLAGYAGGRAVEFAADKIISRVKKNSADNDAFDCDMIYTVNTTSQFEDEVSFSEGDCFRIVAKDNDALIIEIIGAERNPYLVSEEWLLAVSNYESTQSKKTA